MGNIPVNIGWTKLYTQCRLAGPKRTDREQDIQKEKVSTRWEDDYKLNILLIRVRQMAAEKGHMRKTFSQKQESRLALDSCEDAATLSHESAQSGLGSSWSGGPGGAYHARGYLMDVWWEQMESEKGSSSCPPFAKHARPRVLF